ncbi:hypothetical protein [Deinococcus sp.]|uniref:hypothetical protein n=1 Tax=Deinococcus sp. TaxID=47478 RepID=UPI0025BD3DBC|nr:hypothetical protein [Deinococcus sp.]
MELVPAGYDHLTFTDRRGSAAQLEWQGRLIAAWLDGWLKDDQAALSAFSAAPLQLRLSQHYRSAVFVPNFY